MPLMHMKSPKAFKHNIEVEEKAGKPQKQAVAIAYSEKAHAEHKKHLASGGMVQDCPLCGKMPPEENEWEAGEESDNSLAGYADGGEIKKPEPPNPIGYPQGASWSNGGEIKGVHKPNGLNRDTGTSMAGVHARAAADDDGYVSKEASTDFSKDQHRRVLGEMKSMKKPDLYAEGGDVESDDSLGDELHYSLGDELHSALESKDKKQIMDCMEACVLSCMNRR
jgi:hypothetical protein